MVITKVSLSEIKVIQIYEYDARRMSSLKLFFEMHGQPQVLNVAKTEQGLVLLSGEDVFNVLKELREEDIFVALYEMDFKSALKMLLKLTIDEKRVNHIAISEILRELHQQGEGVHRLSNEIGLDSKTVQRYIDLLDFDWDKFNKETEQYKNGQITLF